MKTVIYQFWDGKVRDSVHAGVANMKKYAKYVGADYVFEDNPRWLKSIGMDFGNYSAHYGAFKPLWNKNYRDYDKILFCDTDIFVRDNCDENIFEQLEADIGICEEPFQPKQRTITLGRITSELDNKWANLMKKQYDIDVPRTPDGLVKIYNSGVVCYTQEAATHAREKWERFSDYVKVIRQAGLDSFYMCDQPYLHAMIFATKMNVQFMNLKWNSYVHGTKDKVQPQRRIVDHRTHDTCFVHCQFPGADDMNAEQLSRIVNLPRREWNYELKN